jgi:hypothetical protein
MKAVMYPVKFQGESEKMNLDRMGESVRRCTISARFPFFRIMTEQEETKPCSTNQRDLFQEKRDSQCLYHNHTNAWFSTARRANLHWTVSTNICLPRSVNW